MSCLPLRFSYEWAVVSVLIESVYDFPSLDLELELVLAKNTPSVYDFSSLELK